jgi:hypothetical protein
LSAYSWLQFVTNWVGYEVKADGSINACNACGWLTGSVGSTNLIPVYYAYFIGYYGHANNLPDGNTNPSGPNLTTGGAALIANNRAKIIQMYTYYAQETAKVWPTRPLVWLLEGDFEQYAGASQSQPLSYDQLGQLAADITSAIKTNMPNAVVAIDHSAWLSAAASNTYWMAIAKAMTNYDLVWTTGVGNNNGFLNTGTKPGGITYAALHAMTGKKIFVDESFGASAAADSWSNQPASAINARIAEGVVAVNLTAGNPAPPPNSQARVTAVEPQLNASCP